MNATVTAAPIPASFKGTPQQWLEEFLDRLEITIDGKSFVTGSVAPAGNQGPWLKNGTEWWVWDENTSQYKPLDISASFTPQIFIGDISNGPPDPTKYQIWLQLNGSTLNGIFFYAGSIAGWITIPPVLTPGCITNNLLAANSVGTSNLQPGSVTGAKLANGLPLSVLTPGGERQTITTQGGIVAWRPTVVQSPNLSFSSVVTWNHGIGATPNYVRAVWICISPGEPFGYSVGDEVEPKSDIVTVTNATGAGILANQTLVNIVAAGRINLIPTAAGTAYFSPGGYPAYWQLKIYAGII